MKPELFHSHRQVMGEVALSQLPPKSNVTLPSGQGNGPPGQKISRAPRRKRFSGIF